MPILLSIGTWLAGNWKIVGIAFGAIFLYWKVSGWTSDYIAEQKAEEDRITALTSARDRAVIESMSLQATMWEMQANERRAEINAQQTKAEQEAARAQATAEKDIFEGHDLAKMASKHEKWIEKLSNQATQEQFDEIEDIANN